MTRDRNMVQRDDLRHAAAPEPQRVLTEAECRSNFLWRATVVLVLIASLIASPHSGRFVAGGWLAYVYVFQAKACYGRRVRIRGGEIVEIATPPPRSLTMKTGFVAATVMTAVLMALIALWMFGGTAALSPVWLTAVTVLVLAIAVVLIWPLVLAQNRPPAREAGAICPTVSLTPIAEPVAAATSAVKADARRASQWWT